GDGLEQGWLVHSRKNNTAAQRAGLAIAPWSWNDHYTYPTLCALHYQLFQVSFFVSCIIPPYLIITFPHYIVI
ncbi:MAG: hypothetical protein O4861_17375, partial [Trichodesmium sp. St16_bin4-tuft]|nr:hypothetical protein [Trichodesmium sp. St16_bin4-tuft]MDE5104889.1 hypothetical protein [Trichodesmium sp. St19_bin2]